MFAQQPQFPNVGQYPSQSQFNAGGQPFPVFVQQSQFAPQSTMLTPQQQLQIQQQLQLQQIQQQQMQQQQQQMMYKLVLDLLSPEKREVALRDLSQKREHFKNLAPALWYSTSVMAVLLQEVVNTYSLLSPELFTNDVSTRLCNTLALFQTISSHPETRKLFLKAQIPLYLTPFLNCDSQTRAFEYVRLTSLGVIGALVKTDDVSVISFFSSWEMVLTCLRIMEKGKELSQTVATFILSKVLATREGFQLVCQSYDNFKQVSTVLIKLLSKEPTSRLLKHICGCFSKLAEHPRAREELRDTLPPYFDKVVKQPMNLKDSDMNSDPESISKWVSEVLMKLAPDNMSK